jgi:hypothetical protein
MNSMTGTANAKALIAFLTLLSYFTLEGEALYSSDKPFAVTVEDVMDGSNYTKRSRKDGGEKSRGDSSSNKGS